MQYWMLLHSIEELCRGGYEAYLCFPQNQTDLEDSSFPLTTFLSGAGLSPWDKLSEVLGLIPNDSLVQEIANTCKRIVSSDQLNPVLNKGNIANMELHLWYSLRFIPP